MRRVFGTVGLLVVFLVVVGLSRDWFTVQRDRQGSETEVHVRIHRDKIRSDTKGAAEIAKELGENIEKRFAEKASVEQQR